MGIQQTMPQEEAKKAHLLFLIAPVEVERDGGFCPRYHGWAWQLRQQLPYFFLLLSCNLLWWCLLDSGRLHMVTDVSFTHTHLTDMTLLDIADCSCVLPIFVTTPSPALARASETWRLNHSQDCTSSQTWHYHTCIQHLLAQDVCTF